ncbi:MAG: PSD1 and planctomycete cytochrome C domain-containing protein [Bryobacteraceae bacterium]|nr:PSD1 and planctomycete cytochrome C domain-containing protein [Bryobacteraceae bacterium]
MPKLALFFFAVTLSANTSFTRDVLPILQRNCVGCHGNAQQMSGFSLSKRESAIRGGSQGAAIVPGKSGESALIRRVTGVLQPSMPVGGKLSDMEIATLKKWIDEGAPWEGTVTAAPPAQTSRKITDADRNWWAFRKPVHQAPPAVSDPRWKRNAVDAFIFAKLQERELQPVARADKATLVRRAYLDLTGLPPTAEQASAFVNDTSPEAFTKLVDRLLASPHYGERWGRHWLDVARYADSGGYEQDFTYPNAWRYRDYVIRSFNQDKPYDRFVREQVAGDELENPDYDALTGTGFHRVGSTVGFREKDNPQYRFIYLDDLIGTTTRAFLGMTVSCARCHDHKFDPISQMDYYRLMAVFYPYVNYDHPLAPAAQVAEYESKKSGLEARIAPLQVKVRELEAPYRKLAFEQKLATFPADIQAAVRTPEEKRTEGQKLLATQVLSIRPNNHRSLMKPEDRAALDALNSQIRELQKQMPKPLPVAMGVRDGDYRLAPLGPGDDEAPGKGNKEDSDEEINDTYVPVTGKPYKPPKAYFLERGDYLSRGPEMQPGFLEIVGDLGVPGAIAPSDGRITTGRRRALAEWIASPTNPLTARVMVNRIWQHHFGRGLVMTSSNFGRLGRRPSHPELLDWLALEFIRSGWSMKHMHRVIMNSETYQLASQYSSASVLESDKDNIYLSRYPQRRLEGESIRDAILAVSGKLNPQPGGPAYFPPVAERVRKSVAKGIWQVNEEGPDVWRRGVYSYFKRGMKYPMFEVFDQPDPNVTCESRSTSTVPTQALTLLNNEFVVQQARYFAERVMQLAGPEQEAQVRTAYRIALSREPSVAELTSNVTFLNRQRTAHSQAQAPGLEALADLCDVLINLNEFLYIN